MKSKVVQSRIPEELYEKIVAKARSHRVTVSNFVRNLVEDVIEIHGEVADALDASVKKAIARPGAGEVAGTQEMILHKDRACDRCQHILKQGKKAHLVWYEGLRNQRIICASCHGKLKD